MSEISRGRRRNAARVATRPRPVLPPARTTDRTTHTKKTTRSLARVPRRIAADHRASIVSLAAIPIIARHLHHRDRRLGGEKTPHPPPHRACDSNAPIVLPDTDARIRRAEIDPDRGTFSLTHDDSRCARVSPSREMSSRPSRSRAFRVEEKLFEGWRGCVCVCDES